MALPGIYTNRYGSDLLDSAAFLHQDQLVVPPGRGNRQLSPASALGSPAVFSGGLSSQHWHGGNLSDYPPIHVHPGASATFHLNIFPHTSPHHYNHLFDTLPPSSPGPHLPRLDPFILPPTTTTTSAATQLPQCHRCDYRFGSSYLLSDHLARNAHHCSRCRQCFPSWDEHFGCDDGDGVREHLWVYRHNDSALGGGGRVLGEVEELERGRYYGTEGWVEEERRSRHRSRTRRRRGRRASRGRYGLVERPYYAVC